MQRYYEETVKAKLQQEFGFTSAMQIPRLEKITVNVGVGEAPKNPKLLEAVVAELSLITGQKALVNRAKKAISNFSLRQGVPIGASVTLRRERMWEFLDRLVNVAMPRIRDFRGVPTRSFDGRGNYTMGIREQLIFPEIDYDKVEKIHGMDITFVTSTPRDDQALALLRELGMPFRGEAPVQVGQAA
ncbi:MAG TPA: 50S ribosomal protein L5 [Longimicrobiaceae bacterium]|nr:50S ribosomal protein L5 [Longimicrobiaceae bacterium]